MRELTRDDWEVLGRNLGQSLDHQAHSTTYVRGLQDVLFGD